MSKHAAAAAADSDSDSDSHSDTESVARRPVAPKRARGPNDPKNTEEAQDYLDAKLRDAIFCVACLCRDRAQVTVDRFSCMLTSAPSAATIHDDDEVKISTPRAETESFIGNDNAIALAACIIGDCDRIATTIATRPCDWTIDHVRSLQYVAHECDTRIMERRLYLTTVPAWARDEVDEALQHCPRAVADIIASYIDFVAEFVDRPFMQGVYGIYVDAARRFVTNQQATLRLLEMQGTSRRSMFDAVRGGTVYSVLAVVDGMRVLGENHPRCIEFAEIADSLRENALGLRSSLHCTHTVAEAKAMRSDMARRSAAVFAEEKRLREMGFDVAVQLF